MVTKTLSKQVSKQEIRRHFRNLLHEGSGDASLAESTRALNERLFDLLKNQSGLWTAFQPTGFEADLRPALARLAAKPHGIVWVYPRVEGDELGFYLPEPNSTLTLSRFGILEPDPKHSRRVDLAELHGLLIPGLAFDRKCNRLGRGRGFYDRTLADLQNVNKENNRSSIKIGIALDRQISNIDLPVESYDAPMDWVVTESRTYSRTGGPENLATLSERKSS